MINSTTRLKNCNTHTWYIIHCQYHYFSMMPATPNSKYILLSVQSSPPCYPTDCQGMKFMSEFQQCKTYMLNQNHCKTTPLTIEMLVSTFTAMKNK